MRYCGSCGAEAPAGRFCGRCGATLTTPSEEAAVDEHPAPTAGNPPDQSPSGYQSGDATGTYSAAGSRGPVNGTGFAAASNTDYYQGSAGDGMAGQYAGPPTGMYPGATPVPGADVGSGGRGGRKVPLLIAIAAAVVVVAVVATVLLVNRSSTSTASGSISADVMAYQNQPKIAGQVMLRDLFEHSTAASDYSYTNILAVTPTTFVVSAVEQDPNATSSSTDATEVVVAAIDRSSGAVAWKVADKDLDPQGNAAGESFACTLTQSSTKLICAVRERILESGDAARVDLTVINVADGKFTTTQADGWFNYSIYTLDEDVLLTRSNSSGSYDIVRVDPTNGKDKWTAPVTFMGDDFYGGYPQAGFVQVPEKRTPTDPSTTLLLNAGSGKQEHELDGTVVSNGTDYYSSVNTGTSSSGTSKQGTQRMSVDGKILWVNPDASFLYGRYGAGDPVLALEDTNTLVGLDPASGKELWKSDRKMSGYVSAISSGKAFLTTDNKVVRIVKLSNGEQLGTANGTYVAGGPAEFYTTDAGRLYGWSTDSAKNLWRADYRDLSPTLLEDSTRITASGDRLFAIDARSVGILAESK